MVTEEGLSMDKANLRLLPQINYPEDLRKFSVEELPGACRELRKDITQEVSANPGRSASPLGAIKITVALHYVFSMPSNRLVWDVGYQAYGHKILTGRRELFSINRKLYRLRPSLTPLESQYDTFTYGHASSFTSTTLDVVTAAKKGGENGKKIAAIIGDGTMSGGLILEGLNNASSIPSDLLITLSNNDMNIDHAMGGMEKYLLTLDTSVTYNKLGLKASQWLHQRGYPSENRRKDISRFSNTIKSTISRQQNIFGGMNIWYFGPFDGRDVTEIVRILRRLKDTKGPKLLHLHTTKGRGYKPAEQSQTEWHAPDRLNTETDERVVKGCSEEPPRYQDVFSDTLVELALQNPRIVGITSTMPTGRSMNKLMKAVPDRAFGVGITEGHAMTFSGGMAKEGLRLFCNIYSSFAQRAYDNIIHDLAIPNLPVVLCLDRARLIGEDGPTYHGIFDLAALRPVPNLTIAAPVDEKRPRRLMYMAQLPDEGMFIIRYPCGKGMNKDQKYPLEEIKVDTDRKLKDDDQVTILVVGPVGNGAQKAIEALPQQDKVVHYGMRSIKPLGGDLSDKIGKKFRKVITIEDGVRDGSFGSAVLEWLSDHGHISSVRRMGLPDEFVAHGSVDELRRIVGLDVPHIK